MAPLNAPEHLAHLPAAVLTAIHGACDGDWRRVTLDGDGGFTIHNTPQFRRVELTPQGDTARKLGLVQPPVRRSRPRATASPAVPAQEVPVERAARPAVPSPAPAAPASPVAVERPPAAARPPATTPAPVAFIAPAAAPMPPAAAVEAPRPVPAAETDDGTVVDVPRHPRYLRARLKALGAAVGPIDDDGNAAVLVGEQQIAVVPMVDYRSKQAVSAWRDVLVLAQTLATNKRD
jgi:hypothetical protein